MTKLEVADYLANLIIILESQEDAGVAKSMTLTREYNRAFMALKQIIEGEEKQNETRSRDSERAAGQEDRAYIQGGQSSGSSAVGQSRRA